jgi:prepilin-type N-terminal cleavage/methylation domain-containing protein
MNSSRSSHRAGAFTLVELLCVIAIIGLLAALMLPVLNQSQARVKRIECENNLHQLGIGFQIFMHDHDDKFPMAVPMAAGGSQEYVQSGYAVGGEFYFAYRHFQVLSNELSSPAILICPADTRLPATNFAVLQNSNISYCISVCAKPSQPNFILAADRNLKIGSMGTTTLLPCRTDANTALQWTWELHRYKGNVLFVEGRVEGWNNAALAAASEQWAGNDLALPSVPLVAGAPAVSAPSSGNYYSGANPGAETPPAATKSDSTPHPESSSGPSVGQSKFSPPPTFPTENQGLPEVVKAKEANGPAANVSAGSATTTEETEPAMPGVDQRPVKILRRMIIGFYLLVLLVLLLWFLFTRWRRSQRKKMLG